MKAIRTRRPALDRGVTPTPPTGTPPQQGGRRAFAFSRRNSPELCLIAPPSKAQGRPHRR
ncbi:hypothetical protein EAV90_35395 [Bradyrhizobium vignae]|nr:hypothetical protein EAV90_35395 [Bradyrhizobium vignae]